MTLMKDLKGCLADYTLAMLAAIAQGWGLTVGAEEDKEQIIGALASQMLSVEALATMLNKLSPKELEALGLVALHGSVPAHRLTREYGSIRRFGPAKLERDKPWREPISPSERLWYLGLIYRGYGVIDEQHGEVYFIPPDLLALLPPVAAPQPSFQLEAVPSPRVQMGDETALARDILTVLSYMRRENVVVRSGPYLSRQDTALLQHYLTVEGEERLAFLQHLIRRAGLLRREGQTLKPSLKAREWLQAAPAIRIRILYNVWRDDRGWDELWHIPALLPQDTGWRRDPRLARQKILGYLKQCVPDNWYALDSFVKATKRVDPDFLRPDGDYDSWYIRDAASKRYLTGFSSWDQVEGAWLVYLLTRPLHWLGVTRLGYADSVSTPPSFFAVTSLGAALLELPSAAMPDLPERPLVVQADFTVIATREANLYDCYQLERFADREGQDAATIYRMTSRSVWRSLQEGIEMGQILSFLRRASGGRIPQNVVRALQEWGAKFGQVKLSRVLLLVTKDEQMMREIRAAPEIRAHLGEPISSRATLVDEAKWEELIAALKKLGYWPRIEDSE